MKILIIDDSRSIQKSVSWKIQKMGYEVIGVGNDGREGIQLFAELSPDLTLLDITMPNMDGRECLRGILSKNPQAKVVMLSAIGTQEIIEECLALGALAFIDKNQMMTDQYLEGCVSGIVEKLLAKNTA